MPDFDRAAARARADAVLVGPFRARSFGAPWQSVHDLLTALDALAAAEAIITRVCALHTPETRWQTHPDQEWSYDSAEKALESDDSDDITEADLHTFLICGECGRIEMSPDQHGDLDLSYLEALWPCETRRVIDGPTS